MLLRSSASVRLATLLAASLSFFASAVKAETAPAATAPGVQSLNPVTEGGSPYFSKVVSRLDVGGKMLEYYDYEGRRTLLMGLVMAAMEAMPDLMAGGKGIDPGALVDATGLARSVASGNSLVKDGESWLLRSYSYLPQGREGLPTLLGSKAFPFESAKKLPAGTDLLLDLHLDASTLPATARKIAAACGRQQALEKLLAQPGPADETIGTLLEKANLHLTVGVDLSAWKDTPDGREPVDFIVRVEGAQPLLKVLLPELQKNVGAPQSLEGGMGWEIPILPQLQPEKALLLYDEAGTVTLVSGATYLKKVVSSDDRLAGVADYQQATRHFPAEGNLLGYLSPRGSRTLTWWATTLATLKMRGGYGAQIVEKASRLTPSRPLSFCIAYEPDGIATIASFPFAPDLQAGNLALPALSGSAIALTGARAWKQGSDLSDCLRYVHSVQAAVRTLQTETGAKAGDPLDWNLIWKTVEKKEACPGGGRYTYTTTFPKPGELACRCSEEKHVPKPEDRKQW